ncbi:hypothetical protein ABS642_14385 [Microbacterium sp. A8/3-1]|uniref:Uncharacterized protein n=1 Tax=Microbacterium sp. A8/3-1 TaxID=3160749 RepID=A0AAU7VRS9_9MICO
MTEATGIAGVGIAGGHLIPVVMADLTDHPDIQELLRVHGHVESGDCASSWIVTAGARQVILKLEFIRPVEVAFALAFDMSTSAPIVDSIVNHNALYFVHGLRGDKYLTIDSRDKVLINVPEMGFELYWEGIFLKQAASDIRKRGVSRKQARAMAPEFIEQLRSLVNIQMPPAR